MELKVAVLLSQTEDGATTSDLDVVAMRAETQNLSNPVPGIA